MALTEALALRGVLVSAAQEPPRPPGKRRRCLHPSFVRRGALLMRAAKIGHARISNSESETHRTSNGEAVEVFFQTDSVRIMIAATEPLYLKSAFLVVVATS